MSYKDPPLKQLSSVVSKGQTVYLLGGATGICFALSQKLVFHANKNLICCRHERLVFFSFKFYQHFSLKTTGLDNFLYSFQSSVMMLFTEVYHQNNLQFFVLQTIHVTNSQVNCKQHLIKRLRCPNFLRNEMKRNNNPLIKKKFLALSYDGSLTFLKVQKSLKFKNYLGIRDAGIKKT